MNRSPTRSFVAEGYIAWISAYQWKTVYDHELLYAGPLYD